MTIYFPPKTKMPKLLYWTIHVEYYIQIFKFAGYEIGTKDYLQFLNNSFEVEVDGKIVLFDYGDSEQLPNVDNYKIIFKTHLEDTTHPNIFPWFPISFYDWTQYENLSTIITYKANTNIILNNQKAYGNAIQRRQYVSGILKSRYGNDIDSTISDQTTWWSKFSKSLCYVHVAGHHNNMIDRGTTQSMFFGMCVLTTKLPEILPFNIRLIPDKHYLLIQDDYSDVIDRIEWCKNNRDACVEIGNNVRSLCRENFIPTQLVKWFKEKL